MFEVSISSCRHEARAPAFVSDDERRRKGESGEVFILVSHAQTYGLRESNYEHMAVCSGVCGELGGCGVVMGSI